MSFALEHVSFAYGDRQVFSDLSITLEPDKFIGIIGPNGCGKTTLLDLLMRHQKPQKGTILYNDQPINRYSRRQLARRIALVPQNYAINFPFTAQEVVLMGRYPHMPRFSPPTPQDLTRVREIMDQTHCLELAHRPVTELSGGERQRVVFARALVQEPKTLILDEATANMDVHHSLGLLKLVDQIQREHQIGIIAVFQDINLAARYCQELVIMSDGGIAANGKIDEVLQATTLREVFQVEAKVYFETYSQSHQVVFRQ